MVLFVCSVKMDQITRIWVENPAGITVRQWTNLSAPHGIHQMQVQLSKEPEQVGRVFLLVVFFCRSYFPTVYDSSLIVFRDCGRYFWRKKRRGLSKSSKCVNMFCPSLKSSLTLRHTSVLTRRTRQTSRRSRLGFVPSNFMP